MSDPTGPNPGRSALKHVVDLRAQVQKNVDSFKPADAPTSSYNSLTPKFQATKDATKVAKPEPRIPTTAEKLKDTLAHKDEPESAVARGSRQVAANRMADELRKSRQK